MLKQKVPKTKMGLEGFYRVNIVDPEGRVAGDSGWKKNLIPYDVLMKYVVYRFVNSAGSYSSPSYMHLGSLESTLATNATVLPGEHNKSIAASFGGSSNITTGYPSMTNRFTATFVSNSLITTSGNSTIGCIGLYATTAANSLFCGGSFASSTLGSNQAINCTYDIVWTASTA
jgi:hypothetical protein